jgi:hypothetical protein
VHDAKPTRRIGGFQRRVLGAGRRVRSIWARYGIFSVYMTISSDSEGSEPHRLECLNGESLDSDIWRRRAFFVLEDDIGSPTHDATMRRFWRQSNARPASLHARRDGFSPTPLAVSRGMSLRKECRQTRPGPPAAIRSSCPGRLLALHRSVQRFR